MSTVATVIQSTRPSFLLLALVCVFLGYATASFLVPVSYLHLGLACLGGICAHISVNCFNEYSDFKSGLDNKTVRTPFSGGSGGLLINPNALSAVWYTALCTLLICVFLGAYFALSAGFLIIPIGIFGLFVVVTYTTMLNKRPLICWVSPGLGFGLLMTLGTFVVLAEQYTQLALWVSLVPFLLTNNLLLLNQFPDIEADKTVGRNHIPIAYGKRVSAHLFGFTFVLAFLLIFILFYFFSLHVLSLLACIPLLVGFFVYKQVLLYLNDVPKLIPYMGLNVAITLMVPVLLGLGILIS